MIFNNVFTNPFLYTVILKKTNLAQNVFFYKIAIWQKLTFFCNSANVRQGRVSFLMHHAIYKAIKFVKSSIEFTAFKTKIVTGSG